MRAPYRLAPTERLEVFAPDEPPTGTLAASEPPARKPLPHEFAVALKTVGHFGEGEIEHHWSIPIIGSVVLIGKGLKADLGKNVKETVKTIVCSDVFPVSVTQTPASGTLIQVSWRICCATGVTPRLSHRSRSRKAATQPKHRQRSEKAEQGRCGGL